MKINATTMGKAGGTGKLFRQMISFDPQVYRKVVVVGDAACGKTALVERFTSRRWLGDNYCPTVFEDSSAEVDVGVTRVELALWDTSGTDSRLRTLAYPDKDVVLVCFSLSEPQSLEHVETVWIPEVRHYCSGVPILLVGLQKDAAKKNHKSVSSKDAEHLADKIGVADYVECSARTGKGVDEVFELTAKLSLIPY